MLRSLLLWIAANPEEAAGIVTAFIALTNALAVALETRAPKAAAAVRSLTVFVVGLVRAVRRPDASTGPAAPPPAPLPEKAAAGSYAAPPVAPASPVGPTKESPTVPPVGPFVLCICLTGCGLTAAQVEPYAARMDVAAAALRGVTDACTAGYKAAKTPEDMTRLDAYCPQVADAYDAAQVAAAGLRGAADIAAAVTQAGAK